MTALTREKYSIGWICALHNEYTAAKSVLDERHAEPEEPSSNARDDNHYTLGRIGKHNIVIGVLPGGEYGTAAAASVATNMISSFPSVKIGLMVGIGGGAPLPDENDIRLGDVVVSHPANGYSGVIQYDYGKAIQGEDFQLTRVLNQPPPVLRSAMAGLRSRYDEETNGLEELVGEILKKNKRLSKKYQRPSRATDRLFRADVLHSQEGCGESQDDLVSRPSREDEEDEDNVQVHYGLIATANTLMKDALARDRLAKAHGVLCFEMEAGGLMNTFPCLVIRGICDYSDTHKNKDWQGYAAMTAAGYAKALTNELTPAKVEKEQTIADLVATELTKLQALTQRIISDKESEDIRQWISPADPSINFNRALGVRHEGSGQWILQNDAYKRWKESPGKALWLKGNAGCGKTVLSSSVIQDLQKASPKKLLYFYFDFSDTSKQSLEDLLRSLLHQMHQYLGDESLLYQLYGSCKGKDSLKQPSLDQFSLAFFSMISLCEDIHIVLDALDECTTLQVLMNWIMSVSKTVKQLRLLVTSRPKYEIQAVMSELSDTISLENKQVDEDISRFVHYVIQSDESLSRWRKMPNVQQEIELALVNKAGGMFRWVSCQLDSLKNCLSYPELREALQTLPETLEETYTRALRGIPAFHRPHAITILQFLTHSKHVYRVPELVDAITVSLDDRPRFDPNNRMPIPEELIRYCSSLALVVPETNAVQLAHFSVKEWLLSARLDPEFSHHFINSQAHAKLGQVLLSMVIYITSLPETSHQNRLHECYPLARHAFLAWAKHAALGQDAATSVTSMAVEFLTNPTAFRIFCRAQMRDHLGCSYSALFSPLHFAASAGLYETTKQLIDGGMKIGKDDPSPILGPAIADGEQIVKLLLENNANATDKAGDSQVQASVEAALPRRWEGIARLLADAGADINPESNFQSSLLLAAMENFRSIVTSLLDSGATESRLYSEAMEIAARKAQEKILSLSLVTYRQKASEVTQLQEALEILSAKEYDGNAKFLLDHTVTVSEGRGNHSLAQAIEVGHKNIVQAIIDLQRDRPGEEGMFGRGLRAAAYSGRMGLLQFLFDQGADLNDLDNKKGGILESTCNAWYESDILTTIQFLLDKGADPNAYGGMFGNALQAASHRGHHVIVRKLLDAGADVNRQGGNYGTALQAASFEGHSEVVETLLRRGADVNIQGGQWGNALNAAMVHGDKAVVSLLLQYGALENCE